MSIREIRRSVVDDYHRRLGKCVAGELKRNGYSFAIPEKDRSNPHAPDIVVQPSERNDWFAAGETGIEVLTSIMKTAQIHRPILEAAEADRNCVFAVPDGRETNEPHQDQEEYNYLPYHAERIEEALDEEDPSPVEVSIIIVAQDSNESSATLYSYEDGRATELEQGSD